MYWFFISLVKYFSGIEPTHSPPLSSWQRASSLTILSSLTRSSGSPSAAMSFAAALIQCPRKELAGGGFPAPVEVSGLGVVDYLEAREDDPCLKVEILEQTVGVKFKKVLAVYVHSFTEYAGEYFNRALFGRFQHDFVLLMLDLLVILL